MRGYPSPSILRKIFIVNGLVDKSGCKIFITKGLWVKILFLNELAPESSPGLSISLIYKLILPDGMKLKCHSDL